MNKEIKSVERGWGENSTFFSIDEKVSSQYKVDEIKEEEKVVGKGLTNDLKMTVYCGYISGVLTFEMYAGSDITIRYAQQA